MQVDGDSVQPEPSREADGLRDNAQLSKESVEEPG